jgi:porin
MINLLFCSFVQAAELPDSVSVGFMYDAEPMLFLGDELVNYAHGIELHVDLSSGFGKGLSTWRERDHWVYSVDVQQFSDTGDLGAMMGVVHSPQEIFNPAGFYLGESSLARQYGDGQWYTKFGLVSMDMDFLAPDISGLYVHSAFNNQYNVSMENFAISPLTAVGGVVGFQMTDTIEAKTGVYQVSTVMTKPEFGGLTFEVDRDNGIVAIAQLDGALGENTSNNLPDPSWQVGGFTSWDEQERDRVPSHALYANATLPVQESHRVWMSANYGFHPENNPVPLWVAGGWVAEGLLESRPDDLILFGASWSQLSMSDWNNRELLVEVESHLMITDSITVLPVLQYFVLTPTEPVVLPIVAGMGIVFEI